MATRSRPGAFDWRAWIEEAWALVPESIRRPAGVVVRTFKFYSADNCSIYAAAIAYYAIFSLVPLALVTLSIFGAFVEREQIVDFVFEQFALRDTASVRQDVDQIIGRAGEFSLAGLSFGAIGLFWSGSGIFSALRRGLNATTHMPQGRAFWRSKLLDLALVPTVGLLIVLSIGLTAASRVAIDRAGDLGVVEINTGTATRLLGVFLPTLVSFPTFVLMYRFVPSHRVGWREALVSAGFATVVFEAFKNLIALIFSFTAFTQDQAIYTGIGTALVILFVVFLAGSIILLGAEFGRAAMRGDETAGTLAAGDAPEIEISGETFATRK
jgi:membrane protein